MLQQLLLLVSSSFSDSRRTLLTSSPGIAREGYESAVVLPRFLLISERAFASAPVAGRWAPCQPR